MEQAFWWLNFEAGVQVCRNLPRLTLRNVSNYPASLQEDRDRIAAVLVCLIAREAGWNPLTCEPMNGGLARLFLFRRFFWFFDNLLRFELIKSVGGPQRAVP